MRSIHRLLPLCLLILLAGCLPGVASAPLVPEEISHAVALFDPTVTPTVTPTLYQPPIDATATPTPFQPLPPTEAYYPTYTPAPTTARLPLVKSIDQNVDRGKGSGRLTKQQPANQLNILLLGSDQRPWDRNFRTDTLILATLNADLSIVNLTSFPRDLYVTLPGWGSQRINTAYEFGGIDLLYRTFEHNFGVTPDHYVLINFASFKQVVDSLGGLEVNVGVTVSDYRAGRYVTIQEGSQHMDADDVLWYVRTRKTTNDFQRTRRQQEVLIALFEKMLSLNAIRNFPKFYEIYKDNVTTDLTMTDLLPLLPLAARLTDTSHLNHYFVGPHQVYDWITYDGGMVLMPRPDEIEGVLRKSLNIDR